MNFAKLLSGRIDIFPVDIDNGYAVLYQNFRKGDAHAAITHHDKAFREVVYHVIFSKNVKENQRYIQIFNRGLKKLKESGKYDQYFDESRRGMYFASR